MTNLSDAQAALVAAQKAETDAQTAVNDATGDIAAAQASVAAVTSALTDAGDVLADAQVELTAANVALSDAKAVVVAAQAVVTDLTTVTPPVVVSDQFQTSPFYNKLPSNPVLDKNSAAEASFLNANQGGIVIDGPDPAYGTNDFALPIYDVTGLESPPVPRIVCTVDNESNAAGTTGWGTCQLSGIKVPWPTGALPNGGSDHKITINDLTTMTAYELQGAYFASSGALHCSWGTVLPLAGNGISEVPDYAGVNIPGHGTTTAPSWPGGVTGKSTGSGISQTVGCVRLREWAAGVIPHMLSVSISNGCSNKATGGGNSRPNHWPASTSDMTAPPSSSALLREGSIIFINPSAAAPAGLKPGPLMLWKALQTYGACVIDGGGSAFAVQVEHPVAGRDTDPYPTLFGGDGYELLNFGAGVPWQVMANYDGSATAS